MDAASPDQGSRSSTSRADLVVCVLLLTLLATAPLLRLLFSAEASHDLDRSPVDAGRFSPSFTVDVVVAGAALTLLLPVMLLFRCRLARLNRLQRLLLFALPALPLLQLLPLPPLALAVEAGGWRALSLAPAATLQALVQLLLPLAVLIAALSLPADRLRSLIVFALIFALGESLLALWQLLQSGRNAWGGDATDRLVSGGFVTRQQLAGLLLALLPLGLALTAATIGRRKQPKRYRGALHRFPAAALATAFGRAPVYGAASALLLAAVVLTRHPGAYLLAAAGLVLCAVAFSGRLGGNGAYGRAGATIAGATALLIAWLFYYLYGQPSIVIASGDAWARFADALRALEDVWSARPLGLGFGVADPFTGDAGDLRPWQPALAAMRHSDLFTWLLEGGVAAGLLALLVLIAYLQQWLWLWQFELWSTARFVQAGAGIGLALTAAYALIANALHNPVDAVTVALLAALFWQRESSRGRRSRRLQHIGAGRPVARRPAAGAAAITDDGGDRVDDRYRDGYRHGDRVDEGYRDGYRDGGRYDGDDGGQAGDDARRGERRRRRKRRRRGPPPAGG